MFKKTTLIKLLVQFSGINDDLETYQWILTFLPYILYHIHSS